MTNSCRRPPLPFYNSPKGKCRWCGEDVAPPLRNWHTDCAKAYNLAINSGTQRQTVYARDKGVCKECAAPARLWQADHITALYSIPPSQLADYPACLRFWRAENLQTLCYDHHTKKTSLEATERAKTKRIAVKNLPKEERPVTKSRIKVKNPAKKSITSRHHQVVSYL